MRRGEAMRRIVMAAALTGAGVLVARAVIPKLKLHERGMAGCERMFQQMPEDFPPKRMMRGIEEIRANTARTRELLEDRETDEAEPLAEVSPTEAVAHAA
jgi:hypothetical protein